MSATTTPVQPIAGPLFRQATALPIEGARQQRKLLCLLAAYEDAGHAPSVCELSARMGRPPQAIDKLLDRLVAAGWLSVEWAGRGNPGRRRGQRGQRNRYTLDLRGGER